MTFLEMQACPNCRNENVTVNKIVTLLDAVRYDGCVCNDCGAEWKFYYKISDAKIELEKQGKDIPKAVTGPNGECMCEACAAAAGVNQDEFTFDTEEVAEDKPQLEVIN